MEEPTNQVTIAIEGVSRRSALKEDGPQNQNTVSSKSHDGLTRQPAHSELATMLLKVAT
jgi:hypothetical protein